MVPYFMCLWFQFGESSKTRQNDIQHEKTPDIMGAIFNVVFQEFIQYPNHANVEYMLVGGYATIIHGYNRTTGDMDIWVHQTKQNYHHLENAFKQFQMPVFEMTLDKFLHDSSVDVFSFGRPPVSIDIITQVKGLEFD